MNHSHTWRWTVIGTMGCVVGVVALLVGSNALFSHMQQPHAPPVRLNERQVEDLRRREYDDLIHLPRQMLFLGGTPTIILVSVLDSEGPGSATVKVLKSWKGPSPSGHVLRVHPAIACEGNRCDRPNYEFHAGEELLIISHGTQDGIVNPGADQVWPAAEAQELMGALDRAVKELQEELQDPQTDITRASERSRGTRECASMNRTARCDVAILNGDLLGIKRSELVASRGPPKFCRRISPLPLTWLPPTGADCPPEQEPIWTFGDREGLWCDAQKSPRCMSLEWISRSGS